MKLEKRDRALLLKKFKGGRTMSKKEKRFIKIHAEGTIDGSEIWVDRETGVNYLFHFSGYAGGLTVLLGADGKPVVSPLPIDE